MTEAEEKKARLKQIDKVIVKNFYNSKMHLLLTRPEITAEAEKLSNKIENMFEYKAKKPVEEMSNREFRKYKRAKKRHNIGVNKNLNFKHMFTALICLFTILILGGGAGLIYLSTVKVNMGDMFNPAVEVFCNETAEDLSESGYKTMELAKFSNKKLDNNDINKYYSIKFSFKERSKAFTFKNIYFKIKTKGTGILKYNIVIYNSKTDETKTVYTNESFIFSKDKTETLKIGLSYSFETISEGSYLMFEIDTGKMQGLEGYMLYNMVVNKA